ncbi:MAG TPA: ABC transporter substrate-binding protein [Ilumatobacteraceae bacterium]|nr:ABC transporter substrate-binding protein [Ilumatobacteraceae bacterium]
MKKRFRLFGSLFAVGLVLAACGSDKTSTSNPTTPGGGSPAETSAGTTPSTSGQPAEGAEITIALGSEPTSLDPYLVDDGAERAVNDNVYETLLSRNATGDLQPGLATELPTQVDDLTWQFKLREGVKFHDGSPFNADSVVASINRMVKLIADKKTDNDGFYSSITGAEKVDDTTVNIKTAKPDGVLPARMYWLKMIAASAETTEDMSDAPNGTGPYKFVSRTVGSDIKLESNADYWGDKPSIAKVSYEFVAEGGTRLAGLKSGKYDLITNLPPQDVDQAPQEAHVQGQEHPILILDATEGITADPNVRVALNLAVDKQAIVDQIFGGFAAIDKGQLLSPSVLGFNDSLDAYPYDADKAKQMIKDAGLEGKTIQLVGEAGRWLNDRELLEAIAGYWKAAGLQVQLDILEFGAYLDVLFDRENRADAIYVSSSNDILDPDRQLSTYYQAGGIGSSNDDAELSALVDKGRQELDADARAKTYQDAVKIAYDGAYFVWLVNNQDLYGLSTRLSFTPRVDSKLLVKEMSVTS